MGSDSVGGIWNGRGLWELELDLDRNWTGESDRCDRTLLGSGTGTYVSESDRCDRTLSGSRTSTAWLDSDCLAGIWNGTGESDRCDRTLLGSGTGTYVSESDRCDRTLSGSRTSTAWLDSAWLESAWLESAWLESSPEPEQKDRIRKFVGTSGKWFP